MQKRLEFIFITTIIIVVAFLFVQSCLAKEGDGTLIARIVYAESSGQPQIGKEYIVCTILNRVDKKGYPKTIHNVIYQKNAFSCVVDGSLLWKESANPEKLNGRKLAEWKKCVEATTAAMQDRQNHDKIAYRTITAAQRGCGDSYFRKLTFVDCIGDHLFYK